MQGTAGHNKTAGGMPDIGAGQLPSPSCAPTWPTTARPHLPAQARVSRRRRHALPRHCQAATGSGGTACGHPGGAAVLGTQLLHEGAELWGAAGGASARGEPAEGLPCQGHPLLLAIIVAHLVPLVVAVKLDQPALQGGRRGRGAAGE